jgi:hypothetical protein
MCVIIILFSISKNTARLKPGVRHKKMTGLPIPWQPGCLYSKDPWLSVLTSQ